VPLTLLYHDVVPREQSDASGFAGGGAARYKLTPAEFRQHIEALKRVARTPPLLVEREAPSAERSALRASRSTSGPDWLLTFDDGGVTAYDPIADILEENGWRGHFLITVNYIGSPTFVSQQQIRALRRRGHVIGSHSCSHPERMSLCGPDQLVSEWQRSREVLSDMLGEPITVASVPGGFYSPAVARAAAQAGFKVLFNSEPTLRPHSVDGCLVLGRYTIYRGMSAEKTAALVAGNLWPRLQQSLLWNAKKVTKALGGRLYLHLRKRLLARAYAKNQEPGIRGQESGVRNQERDGEHS
jgi:peptidoglycan/xylan/chitin deacetylase (PgdA/CDA1 family)